MSADVVRADGLSFRYPDGREAIRDVDIVVAPGEAVGLIGPNGAGKTTLIHLLAGLLEPTRGSVSVFGKTYSAADARRLRQHVGVVFQETDAQLFSASVFDDVAFGPLQFEIDGGPIEAMVRDALARVGLSGFEHRVSQHLSSGERRRVALATVLSYHPSLLILDEPTSDLDARGQRELIDILRSTSQARIVASHDLEFILRTCDRVDVVSGGRIVASGPAPDIVTDAELLRSHGLACPLGWTQLGPGGIRALLDSSSDGIHTAPTKDDEDEAGD